MSREEFPKDEDGEPLIIDLGEGGKEFIHKGISGSVEEVRQAGPDDITFHSVKFRTDEDEVKEVWVFGPPLTKGHGDPEKNAIETAVGNNPDAVHFDFSNLGQGGNWTDTEDVPPIIERLEDGEEPDPKRLCIQLGCINCPHGARYQVVGPAIHPIRQISLDNREIPRDEIYNGGPYPYSLSNDCVDGEPCRHAEIIKKAVHEADEIVVNFFREETDEFGQDVNEDQLSSQE